MDEEKYLNNESAAIESLSGSVVSLLLNEGKAVIPELGYLELKVFPGKRTVLFRAAKNAAQFSDSEDPIQSQIYDNLTIPLKEGKIVTLPEVGIFHPIKKADGSSHISYTMSPALRKLLNGGEKKDKVVPQEEKKRRSVQMNTGTQRGIIALVGIFVLILIVFLPGSKIIVFLILGFYLPRFFQFKKRDTRNLQLLWAYHLIFCIYYYYFLRADSYTYYLNAAGRMTSQDFWESITTQGTEFINAICFLLVKAGLSSYFSLFLFFSLLGQIAITLLYKIILTVIPFNSRWGKIQLFPFLLFLPNLHLWTVAVGKDTLLFLCIILVAYGFIRISKRFPLVVMGLLLSFWIRPHVTLILLVSFGFAYAISSKISISQRTFMLIFLIAAAGLILPSVLNFVQMDELSVDELEQFSDRQAAGLSDAGSSVDLASYPFPLKVFTFLYRPLFFDINGIPALIISFENLLWLLLSIRVLRNRFFATFKAAPLVVQGSFLFFIMGVLVFCMSMSNLGIIIRQRNMFLPGLILFILWSFSYKKELTLKRKYA